MNLDLFQLSLVRVLFGLGLLVVWLFLPAVYLFSLVIFGAVLFEYYLEGLLLFLVVELFYNSPGSYLLGTGVPFLGTITILIILILRSFIKNRLIMYN